MKQQLLGIALSVGMVFGAATAVAQDLGWTAEQTYEIKTQGDEPILFIDVRDPVEIMFIGHTDVVDANIPFLLVDRYTVDENKGVFAMNLNPNFVDEVKQALKDRNLPEDTKVVTMCRSGNERGKPSAALLREAGLNAYYVINGFQGSAVKSGEKAGMRVQNGWQNVGLPWQAKMNAEKTYRTPRAE